MVRIRQKLEVMLDRAAEVPMPKICPTNPRRILHFRGSMERNRLERSTTQMQ